MTGLNDLILLEQVEDGLGGLGALLQPDLGLLHINADGLTGASDGIDEPKHFERLARGDAVVLGDDDVVERALLGTIASKSDRKHGHSLSRKVYPGIPHIPSAN